MSRYSRDMPPESYDDIIKGGKLPDKQVVIRTPAGAAPAVKTGSVSSVFEQGTGRPVKTVVPPGPREFREIDEIETIQMKPPATAVVPPSYYEDLYYALAELGKAELGKKLTQKEAQSLRRWCSKSKLKGLTLRKLNDGPTPYGAWVTLPKEQA